LFGVTATNADIDRAAEAAWRACCNSGVTPPGALPMWDAIDPKWRKIFTAQVLAVAETLGVQVTA